MLQLTLYYPDNLVKGKAKNFVCFRHYLYTSKNWYLGRKGCLTCKNFKKSLDLLSIDFYDNRLINLIEEVESGE